MGEERLRGLARMMRVGLFKPVHVKTLVAQEQRMLLTSRKLLQRKMLDVECDLRRGRRSHSASAMRLRSWSGSLTINAPPRFSTSPALASALISRDTTSRWLLIRWASS